MKRRNFLKRALAGILTLCMMLSLVPASVFSARAEYEITEDDIIKQTLLESVDAEEYPLGMFDFLTPRMETRENIGEVEFAIVRRGNTDEAASVILKIIDMTAVYGEDYVIRVSGRFTDQELTQNPDSVPLYNDSVYSLEDTTSVGESGVYLIEPDTTPVVDGNDLQDARTIFTGEASNTKDWRETDEAEISVLTAAYGDLYDELEGIECMLKFAPGEYMKVLKFVTLNDHISEDDEQVLFVLCHPENGAVSDNPTGYMNIVDDEEPEELTFGFKTDIVTVDKDSFKAELIVERLTGLYRYGTVEVFTAEKSAMSGVHYDSFVTELTFVPGQQYQKIEIPIKSHPSLEDVEFRVYVGDYEDYASVVIQSSAVVGQENSTPLESGDAETYSQRSSTNDVMPLGTNDSLWCRKEKVTLDYSVNGASSYGLGCWSDGTLYVWMNLNNRSNATATATLNVDLSMVGKLKTKSDESWEGTWYDDTWWFFGTWGDKGYYNNMWSEVYIGDTMKVSKKGRYEITAHLIELDDDDRKAGYIQYKIITTGNTRHVQSGFSKDIELYYLPIEVIIGAFDDDAMIQRKIYTSPTEYTNEGDPFLAGKLKFANQASNVTSQFFYNTDIVELQETARSQVDGTYLWGIKFECKAGADPAFYYYEGTSFSIKDLYTGKLRDSITGEVIGKAAMLNHTTNGEEFPCYKIYPVYRQKTAFTTIKIDEAKSQFATGTFANEQTIKTGVLDKIQINIAGKDDWSVSGFSLGCGNRGARQVTTVEDERALYKATTKDGQETYKTWSPVYKTNSDWAQSIVNAGAATPGSFLFQPTKSHQSLVALYQKPEITVAVNPRANSKDAQSQGYVAYVGVDGTGQIAKYKGTDDNGLLRGDEIHIAPYQIGGIYQLIGGFWDNTETGYKFQWQDFTGDINRDGKLSAEEIAALGDGYQLVSTGVYAGDIFSYIPRVMGSPVIYYNIVPKAQNDTGLLNSLSGNVFLRGCSVIENSKLKPNYTVEPIANATITAGGETAVTNADGTWEIESASFAAGEIYTATLAYGGRSYTGDVTVNRWATDFMVDEYNTFNVTNFNAFRVTNDSEYENVVDWNLHGLSNSAISNEDSRHLYTFEIEELIPTTAVVGKVEVKRYSADGVLKKTYIAVYNEENGFYEVKDPALLEEYSSNPEEYNYSFNPAAEAIVAGDYLTVRVYDQYGVGYIEHEIGFGYKPKLSVINLVNSFQSPFNSVIDFVGDVDMLFDLGLTAKLDALDNKASSAVENKLTVTTDDNARTISFGWNKEFTKSYDSSEKEDDKEDDKEDKKKKKAPSSASDTIKDEAKKLEGASDKPGKDKDKKDAATKTANKAVDKDDKANEKTSKVTADMTVKLSVALELVMGYDKEENRYYFQDFVVTGVVSGEAGATYEYTTPIGIVIFVKGSLSGDITALMAIEPYYQNPAEPKYLYMDESGTIDLTSIGNADVDRQLSIYGKLMIRPKVTLTVGASVISDKIASVSLNGAADFDMVFNTVGQGDGNVTLTAELVLEILGGMVSKKWLIEERTYDMFRINRSSMSRLMSVDGDYRYDVITDEDTSEQLYLENRSDWNTYGTLFTTGADNYNEILLQTGAYPYAYPQIFTLYEGDEYDYAGATSEQLLLFLDSDSEKVCLMYSIYEDIGDGRGYTWTQPAPVDANTAGDDTPRVEDLGDRLLITWSSQSKIDSDNPIDKLNSRDIKAVFLDKNTKTFSDVQYVTKTTDADRSADDYASASYYKVDDNTELLMVTYIKTQYEQTGDELVVGDVLDAYSTIAYRFYDFSEGEWVDTYSGADAQTLLAALSRAELEQFEENWYGQGFVDLSSYVTVDESDLLIPEDTEELRGFVGLWSREPYRSEISIAHLDSDPRVVEHETINCGHYAVSAYLVDLDKNISTINDRDIFLQLYDYQEGMFYPAMRLTNDAHNQVYLEFMETLDGVKLYYISDGDIVQQNISDIVKNLIEAEVNGTKVLVQNKCYTHYSGEKTILESPEEHPYTEFIVNTDGYNNYLAWTQSGISVAEGIDLNSQEATLPENYYVERQMYMVMETFRIEEHTYTDDFGNILTYPVTDGNGNIIDWNLVPDINGEVGKVEAGDPIVKRTYASQWTKPVQVTDEQGANFSDIDFVRITDGFMRFVYLKGVSEIMEIGGELMPAENTDNRALISADFNFNVERYTISINNADEIPAGGENVPVFVTVKNESLLTMTDILVPLYVVQNEEQSLVGYAMIDELLGGDSTTVAISWEKVPNALEDISLMATVEHYGMEFASATATLEYNALVEVADVFYEMIDRNTAQFTVTVKNTGSENAVDERVYLNCNGVVSKSDEFDLIAGDTEIVTFIAEIPEEAFEESRNETTITESASLKVYTTGSIVDLAIVRSADAALEEILDRITGLRDTDGYAYSDTIQLNVGDMLLLEADDGEDAIHLAQLSVVSEDESVVSVINGVLIGETKGSATVHVELYPVTVTYLTDDSGVMRQVHTYNTLPSCLIQTMEIDVLVGMTDKEIVSVTLPAAENATYDKAPHTGYTGTPSVDGYDGDFVITYSGRNGTQYGPTDTPPTDAGDYTVTFAIPEDHETLTGSAALNFTIKKAPVTIKVENKSAYYGDIQPALTYTVEGLLGSDVLLTEPTLTTDANMNKVGSYVITASGAYAGENYEIVYVDGTLTVYALPQVTPVVPAASISTSVTTEDGKVQTTVVPSVTISGNAAVSSVSGSDGSKLLTEVLNNNSNDVVIKPEIPADVTKTEILIPASVVGQLGEETSADLIISTPIAKVSIPNGSLSGMASGGGTVTISVEKAENKIALKITNGAGIIENVHGGIVLTVPYDNCQPGTVAVLVYDDGTREVVRKSVANDNAPTVTVPLSGSAALEIVENGKTFADVLGTDWYSAAVEFASAHQFFSGTTETIFSPDSNMTRGMLAMVLYNMESNPGHDFNGAFRDVADGVWYTEAIYWAAEKRIVSGYGDGQFGPNDSITREQLVVMLWRYAGSPVSTCDVSSFTDSKDIADYAQQAMRWAIEHGIISGHSDGHLDPGGNATRAQVAQVLMNFVKNVL